MSRSVTESVGLLTAISITSSKIECNTLDIKGTTGYLTVSTNTNLTGNTITIGNSASSISFFGQPPASKLSVERLDTMTGTPSSYDIAVKINEIINKLSELGLVL